MWRQSADTDNARPLLLEALDSFAPSHSGHRSIGLHNSRYAEFYRGYVNAIARARRLTLSERRCQLRCASAGFFVRNLPRALTVVALEYRHGLRPNKHTCASHLAGTPTVRALLHRIEPLVVPRHRDIILCPRRAASEARHLRLSSCRSDSAQQSVEPGWTAKAVYRPRFA